MPYYYDTARSVSSNGTGSTESCHLAFLTVANQAEAKIKAIYGSALFGTAGGARLRVKTCATAATGGTAQVPQPRNSRSPACQLTVVNDTSAITPGGTPLLRLAVGLAQTGGNGGWVALEAPAAITLRPNAGANGNAEVHSIANAASVPIDITVEHSESD